MVNNNKILGKTIIVSGGMGFLGRATAKQLIQDGYNVAFFYKDSKKQDALNFEVELGKKSKAYRCDISDLNQLSLILKDIQNDFENIYGCVHAAWGKITRKSILNTEANELKQQMDSNFIPSFNFISSCVAILKKMNRGVVIGITTAGVVLESEVKSMGAYIPAKFALQGLLATLRQDLKAFGVRVYSLAPGFMAGGINQNVPESFKEIIRIKSKTKKLTRVGLVAKKVSYLCSESVKDDKLTFIIAEEHGILE